MNGNQMDGNRRRQEVKPQKQEGRKGLQNKTGNHKQKNMRGTCRRRKWHLRLFADDIIVFFNLLRLLSGLKFLVFLSLRAFPEDLDLLALRDHLLDQGYPKVYRQVSQ